eukprot:4610920-Pyramimonas_sp.AAC.1
MRRCAFTHASARASASCRPPRKQQSRCAKRQQQQSVRCRRHTPVADIIRGLTRTCSDARKESTGESNSRVIRWLDKVLTVNSTASVSSPCV